MTLVHDSLISVLDSKLHSIDEPVQQYIEEVLADTTQQFSMISETLAPLLVSLELAESEESAEQLLRTILSKMEVSSTDNKHEDEFDRLSAPIKLADVEAKPEPKIVENYQRETLLREKDPNRLTIPEVLELTRSHNPVVRKQALRNMCPCHVQKNVDVLWQRILEMTHDEDPEVRYQVMHNLCDGSPACREDDVIRALEGMHNDSNKKVRRKVHQVLTHYRHTGKWNIL